MLPAAADACSCTLGSWAPMMPPPIREGLRFPVTRGDAAPKPRRNRLDRLSCEPASVLLLLDGVRNGARPPPRGERINDRIPVRDVRRSRPALIDRRAVDEPRAQSMGTGIGTMTTLPASTCSPSVSIPGSYTRPPWRGRGAQPIGTAVPVAGSRSRTTTLSTRSPEAADLLPLACNDS